MIFAACEQDELIVPEQQPEQSKQQLVNPDFPMLQYSSRDAFYAALESGVESTRSTTSNSFISLLDEIPVSLRSASNDDEEMSYYELNGYDELVPNKDFAKLLNPNGEIMVNDTIYLINRNGTYYFPKEKEEEFRNVYAMDSIGTEVSEDLYELADNIYRFDTFKELKDLIEIDLDSLDFETNEVETRSSNNEPNYASFPSYKADRHTWLGKLRQGLFGNDKWYSVEIKNISKKRKVRGRLYAYHYAFYSEAGITGQVKKKNWIGWSKEPAQEIRVGWRPVVLTVKIPELARIQRPVIQQPVLTNVLAEPFPHKTARVEWVHVLLPTDLLTDQQVNQYTQQAIQMAFSHVRSKHNSVTEVKCKNIVMAGPSTIYHVMPDDFIIAYNAKEINKVFTSNYNIHFSADLLNLPSSIIGWAKTLTGSLKQEYPKLHSGEAIICGKEQNKWAGMRIVK